MRVADDRPFQASEDVRPPCVHTGDGGLRIAARRVSGSRPSSLQGTVDSPGLAGLRYAVLRTEQESKRRGAGESSYVAQTKTTADDGPRALSRLQGHAVETETEGPLSRAGSKGETTICQCKAGPGRIRSGPTETPCRLGSGLTHDGRGRARWSERAEEAVASTRADKQGGTDVLTRPRALRPGDRPTEASESAEIAQRTRPKLVKGTVVVKGYRADQAREQQPRSREPFGPPRTAGNGSSGTGLAQTSAIESQERTHTAYSSRRRRPADEQGAL